MLDKKTTTTVNELVRALCESLTVRIRKGDAVENERIDSISRLIESNRGCTESISAIGFMAEPTGGDSE